VTSQWIEARASATRGIVFTSGDTIKIAFGVGGIVDNRERVQIRT